MITGPQGSGKTTQAKALAKKLGLCLIEVGAMLRERVKKGDPWSLEVRKTLDEGQLMDDQLVSRLVKKRISESDCQQGFVSDGYPRTFSQHLECDAGFDKVLYLKISDEEAIKRLLKRGREDDNLPAIEKRLTWYHEETKPLLDYYQDLGILVTINGERPIKEVAKEIEGYFKDQP
ncbi:MAG: nucleoside monophosphate kinase [bacterium]|nr:nucleoside monophosphate kinase [bacterium]